MTTHKFLHKLKTFEQVFEKAADTESQLNAKISQLKQKISANSTQNTALKKANPLAQSIAELNIAIEQGFNNWDAQIQATRPMKALSEAYSDRIIFLVFGKVNAGKSSLSNFIAELFPENEVKRFRFSQGQVSYFKEGEKFAEGFTETTVEIQGVELGRNFVLIDSPGLHSVKGENGDLTRRFVDSTDAILWLTPSTSPGQVQELHDLKDELAKKKPLLPIITRSDWLDEGNWCDIQNDIIQILKNKTIENRKLQNDDVLNRLKDFKGLANSVDENQQAILQEPTSISIHAYMQSEKKLQDLTESGLKELFEKLTTLVDKATTFKKNKANQQVIYFLNDMVISTLDKNISPAINTALNKCQATISNMNKNKQRVAAEIKSSVKVEVSTIINKHKSSQDKKLIMADINALISQKINVSLKDELADLMQNIKIVSSSLTDHGIDDFTDKTIDVKRVKGSMAQSITSSVGGIGGAGIGAMVGSAFGPVGTAVGGLLGGLIGGATGSAAGDFFVHTEMIPEVIGISTEEVVRSLVAKLDTEIPKQVDQAFAQIIEILKLTEKSCLALQQTIGEFRTDVKTLQGAVK